MGGKRRWKVFSLVLHHHSLLLLRRGERERELARAVIRSVLCFSDEALLLLEEVQAIITVPSTVWPVS